MEIDSDSMSHAHYRLISFCSLSPWKSILTTCRTRNTGSFLFVLSLSLPGSGELRMQKLKSHLLKTQSLKGLPLKPGVGQHIAMYATFTATDFFLAYFYPSGPFTSIFFPKPLPISQVLAVANTWFLCRPGE